MKKIDETVIRIFKELQSTLRPKDFRRHIELTLPEYEVTEEFIETFSDTLNMSVVCQQSLSPECIKYLCETDQFDLNAWLQGIANKNIDILVDDDFVKQYNIDVNEILSNSNKITQTIFNKFSNNCSDKAFKNIILKCKTSDLTIDMIASNLDRIGSSAFNMKIVRDDLINKDSVIEKMLLTSGKAINPIMLTKLMNILYDPESIRKYKDDLTFKDPTIVDMTELQNNINSVIQKYPTDIAEFLMETINFYIPLALLDKDLLLMFLTEHDNISEECLLRIYMPYVQTGARDSLVNYCKNHGYRDCLLALKLSGK